jgi:hypothetical protein
MMITETNTMIPVTPRWSVSIDKLSIVYTDPVPDRVVAACAEIVHRVKSGHYPGAILTGHRRFEIQVSLPIVASNQRFLLQAGPKGQNLRDYRLEFNPSAIGPLGMAYILDVLNGMLDQNGGWLLRDGLVSRIDIALDLPNISADQVIARSRKQQAHGIFSDRHGTPANIYFGRRKNNNTSIYTKQKDDGRTYLRVERRMIPKIQGSQIALLPNPFAAVQLVHTDAFLPYLGGLVPDHIFDSIRVRGFTHVLQKLDPVRGQVLEALLKSPDRSLFPSMAEIWQSWPDAIANCGLGLLTDESVSDEMLFAKNDPAFLPREGFEQT